MEYLGHTIESMVGAARSGFTVRQIPVEMRERTTADRLDRHGRPRAAKVSRLHAITLLPGAAMNALSARPRKAAG
ncbi:hypothetical protein [Streptomyces sp. NPDC054958]